MSTGQTVRLTGPYQRKLAKRLIDAAPDGAVVNVREANRTTEQSAKMWALLSDVSRAKPGGRKLTADLWKCVMMNACGHAVQFENALNDGPPFPVGFRSSRLTVAQMSELIEFVQCWGAQNGVTFSDEARAA